MSWRFSKSKSKAQGRAKRIAYGEQQLSLEVRECRTYAEAYQVSLAKELLIRNFQEDYGKCF